KEERNIVGTNFIVSFIEINFEVNFLVILDLLFMLSILINISETPNKPINAGTKFIPFIRFCVPKVNLGAAVVGSIPIIATRWPKHAVITPFNGESAETLEMIRKPNIVNAKNSGAPNCKAILANKGEKKVRVRTLNKPPNVEATTTVLIALPTSPFCAKGYPSKTVAAAAGVPGIRIRIEATEPPNVPPINTETIKVIEANGDMPKVKGRSKAIVIVDVSPGIDPTTIPNKTPITIVSKISMDKICSNPCSNISFFLSFVKSIK